ncbi:Zn(2)-Cys(6) binuclear cluster domain-containing protein [Mycena maculata]|uniref:Zn(2)-Cys(6) binuclear cluster domain-containing protein n=1 Tax=Mycena maculata TaxID=230809 RepID=A0AAD7MPB5_9AGAR|nr:Zn(2)-Cys(6) binuclear cluster domain-containing protein [Mycena maculata]
MNQEQYSQKPPLNKGKACFNCRRRKVKCDAKKPICTPCVRFIGGSLHDCEYTEMGLAQSQVLEEQISIVESRIQELRQPKEMRTSVGLHNPYQPSSSSGSSNPQFDLVTPRPGHYSPPNLASRPRSLGLLQTLINSFLKYAPRIGFFLSPQLFEALSSGAAPSQIASPALLDAIYLWGSHLSRSEKLAEHEPSFLSDALRSAAATLSTAHCSKAVIHAIQAEMLIAQYFFRNARILEGKYHASVAVSISLSSGLHKIRSSDARDSTRPTVDSLSPAANALEEGERINAFWAVLTLNNCWFAADGSPADVSYAAHGVDTPWPLDIGSYTEDSRLLPFQSSATIDNFLTNFPDRGGSLPALHAKAGVVFEQASRLAARYTESTALGNRTTNSDEFSKLDGVIEAFKRTLPRIRPDATQPLVLVIHTLAHVATIQLHNPFSMKSSTSRSRAGSAAMAVVTLLRQMNVREFGYIDAIVGTLWTAACQVLTTELSRTRYSSGGPQSVQQLCEAVETLLSAMSVFSEDCRMIELQLSAAQENYAAVRNR